MHAILLHKQKLRSAGRDMHDYETISNKGQIPPCDKLRLGHQNDGGGHLWCVLANTPHGVIPAKVS